MQKHSANEILLYKVVGNQSFETLSASSFHSPLAICGPKALSVPSQCDSHWDLASPSDNYFAPVQRKKKKGHFKNMAMK